MSLEGRVAVIGWGSLIWDLDDLAPKVAGDWLMRAGPELPFEFSRISPKRKMGLVVCIDPNDGTPCPTHAIRSVRSDIHAAAGSHRAKAKPASHKQAASAAPRTARVVKPRAQSDMASPPAMGSAGSEARRSRNAPQKDFQRGPS